MSENTRTHLPLDSSFPPVPSGAWLAHGLFRMSSAAADIEVLERAVIEWLLHPQGGGVNEAAMLVWNTRAECFKGWLRDVPRTGRPLSELFETSARASDERAHERTARFRQFQSRLSEIGEPERGAWATGEAAVGRWTLAGEPWGQESQATAMRMSRNGSPFALLIVRHDPQARVAAMLAHAVSVLEDAVATCDRAAAARRRDRHIEALAEMAQSCVSAMNVAEALHLAARLAVQATGSRGSAVWRTQDDITRLEVTHGSAGQRERLARGLGTLMQDALGARSARVLDRSLGDARIAEDVAPHVPSVIMQPVVAYGRPLGALAVYDRATLHPGEEGVYDREDVRFMSALADQLGLVLDQAARYDAVRVMQRQNDDLRSWMRREERLASMGEVAARGAREVRNPLASIGAFARRTHGELDENDPHREYLEIVIREADRLERIMDEQLEWTTQTLPVLKLHSINAVMQEALQAAGHKIVRRRVRLLKRLGPDLPELLLDPDRMRLVVSNVLNHALDAVAVGGRVRVTSRRAGGHVIMEVAHDGLHENGSLMDQLFVPFASSREGAPAVGLGVASQIVREHGGEIRVRSDGEWSQVLSFTLPVRGNEERRAAAPDRRTHRGDRRDRFPVV